MAFVIFDQSNMYFLQIYRLNLYRMVLQRNSLNQQLVGSSMYSRQNDIKSKYTSQLSNSSLWCK